jgi:phage head maturation protease
MGWMSAVAQVAREMISVPKPFTLDLEPAQTFDQPYRPIDQLLMAMRTGDLSRVDRDQALSVPAVLRGRNELCAIANIPLAVYRGGTALSPQPALMRQFDPDCANVVVLAALVEDLAFEAIGWWRKTGLDQYGFPVMIKRVAPHKVSLTGPDGKTDPRWVWITEDDGRGPRQVPATEMIRFDSPNPGVLKAGARSVRIAIALDRITEMYAQNPALREYFTDGDNADVEPMAEEEIPGWLAEYVAGRQVSPVAWIPSTVKRADVSSPSPRDLTLVDLQQRANLAIANGLGIDPEDLGVSTTSRTYQNAVDRKQDKINRVYAAYMKAITDRLSMGDVTPRGQTVAFDLTDYLKSDPVTQAAYWKALKDMKIVDETWVGEQAGIDPAVTARAMAAAPAAPAPAEPAQSAAALRLVSGRFADDGPAHTFAAADFATPPPPPAVDAQARTITGLAVPYNAVANKFGMKYSFAPGSLEYSAPVRVAHLQDHTTPVGFTRSITDSPEGPVVELYVGSGPDGSPVKMARDQLLYDAADGVYGGLSIGVDFNMDPESGDVTYDADTDTYVVQRATWRETSTVSVPAFDDARITQVTAARQGVAMHCPHCQKPHAPGISCATFAAQTAPAPAPAGSAVQTVPGARPEDTPGYAAFAAFLEHQRAQAPTEPAPAPVLVSAHHSAQVTEPAPYRFDRKGNLRAASHDFSSDLFEGWKNGDQAARDRAQSFLEAQFTEGEVGTQQALTAQQQFAITPANVVNLNYPQNRPEMYVDQMDYQYPMYDAMNKGTLDAVTPFVIPKFNSSSGLVADHVTGTEPTPGAFTATAQTITPSALSGKVEITREAFDQGGNPQMSGLIWRQMVRAWYEGLEAYAQAQLVAAAASIPDITITTALADAALDQALADAIVPLQYIRGGDRFRTVFTQIDLYKAMVKAKDGNSRRLYPSIGAQNAVGTADPRYSWLDAHGKLWVPAWATAATGTVAASSWMFDPDVVCLWASAPKRIDLQWRVAWVDMGIWGYKAFGITDYTRTRELVYDPI